MRNFLIGLLACVGMFSAPYVQGKVSTERAAQKVEKATAPSNALTRFGHLRFYLATDTLSQEPSLWESLFSSKEKDQHVLALAVYLTNMHVSNQFYHTMPSQLTFNYLGVLDGIVRGPKPFDVAHSSAFYKKNRTEVDKQLTIFLKFFEKNNWPAPTQAEIRGWLRVLEQQPRYRQSPVYLFPANNLLQAPVTSQVRAKLKPLFDSAMAQATKQVVVYDESDLKLEDLDTKIGNYSSHRKYTYRWVKDECYYSSYLTGREVGKAVSKQLPWDTRVYMLTAVPKKGEFLVPVKGDRFKLADGAYGLHWRYHTALLVVVAQGDSYVPVVLDSFLGGEEPLSLDQWFGHFSAATMFRAVPFLRNRVVDNALKTPSKREGTKISINGTVYEPAPVEW